MKHSKHAAHMKKAHHHLSKAMKEHEKMMKKEHKMEAPKGRGRPKKHHSY